MLTEQAPRVSVKNVPGVEKVLTPAVLRFITQLEREFGPRRRALLAERRKRQLALDSGEMPDFLPQSRSIREEPWQIGSVPDDLQKRHVEITGPTDKKMVINALNSGADIFMADFEDANSPTWPNMIQGQLNLCHAIMRTLKYTSPEGRHYTLQDELATLMVRPRGWHLEERHIALDGEPMSASLFDFGVYFFNNARRLLDKRSGPYFYLPKLEGHLEARLWNEVFTFAQEELGLPAGAIKVTVLIETIFAALEMDEILYELREHIVGLNAGRWDYIFSIIKKFRNRPEAKFILPDRSQITMTVPFMRAYTELLVKTCHQRGAHAIGGMAAFIPSRKDVQVNEQALAKVRDDKLRESSDGFDGTWVAHPDLVPAAKEIFKKALGERPHQKDRLRDDVKVTPNELLDFRISGGEITQTGLCTNISVALQYLEAWLRGFGAVAINNLMEDTATAEICRAQLWQWIHHSQATLSDGRQISMELFRDTMAQELKSIQQTAGKEAFSAGRFEQAAALLDQLATGEEFAEFLTPLAYQHLEESAGALR